MRKKKLVLILMPILLLLFVSVSANAAFLLTRIHTENLQATEQSIANVSDLLSQSTSKVNTLKQQLSDTKDQNTNLLNNQNTLLNALNVTDLDAAEAKINDMSAQISALKDMGITNVDQITSLKKQLADLKTSLSLGDDFDPTTNLVDSVNNKISEQVAAKIAEQAQTLEQQIRDQYADIFADAGNTADWLKTGPVLNKVTNPYYIASGGTTRTVDSNYSLVLKKIDNHYFFSIYSYNPNTEWIWAGSAWIQVKTIQGVSGKIFLNAYRDGYLTPLFGTLDFKTLNSVSMKDYMMVYASLTMQTEKAFLPGLPAAINTGSLTNIESSDSVQYGDIYEPKNNNRRPTVTWVPDATNSLTGTFQLTVDGYDFTSDHLKHVYQYVPHPDITDSIYSGGVTNRTINDGSNIWKEIK